MISVDDLSFIAAKIVYLEATPPFTHGEEGLKKFLQIKKNVLNEENDSPITVEDDKI
jgi:hypothetical protein